jgi:hypothetical protein
MPDARDHAGFVHLIGQAFEGGPRHICLIAPALSKPIESAHAMGLRSAGMTGDQSSTSPPKAANSTSSGSPCPAHT